MPEPFLDQTRLASCCGRLNANPAAQTLGRGVGTLDSGDAHGGLDVLVGLGVTPKPQPRCLVPGSDAPAWTANPLHEFQRVHKLGGNRHASVADCLALLQGPKRDSFSFQVHEPGG